MCTGNQTEMACGHVLTHYTERCEKGQPKPCPDPELNGPRQHLADSCAQCDPEFQKSKLSRDQKIRHDELVAQLIEDKRVNGSKEARRLLECMQKLRLTVNREIGEVKTTSFSEDVEFPGSGKHRMTPSATSKWIDGKCVWSDEALQSVAGSQAREISPSRTSTTEAIIEELAESPFSGPPRLRTTKKGYFNRLSEEIEQPPISGPPRLRTNKPYSGPRENVVVFEELETQQALRPKSSLRRTKKVAGGLNSLDAESNVKKSTRPNVGVTLNADPDSDEETWILSIAEKRSRAPYTLGSGSVRSFRDRMLK